MIAAGRLDRYVTLIRPNYVSDDAGQTTASNVAPENCPEVPAMVKQESGTEQLQNGAVRSVTKYSITIRYDFGIRSDWTLIYRGKTLRIVGMREIGRCDELEITAVETR